MCSIPIGPVLIGAYLSLGLAHGAKKVCVPLEQCGIEGRSQIWLDARKENEWAAHGFFPLAPIALSE
jgi:hypothetical protein